MKFQKDSNGLCNLNAGGINASLFYKYDIIRAMKIDLVYLWVDGSDAKWRAKKNKALKDAGRPPLKDDAIRFNDNDELRYSLRSAEKFAPWINHIFIVTDAQIPKWLNIKNPKITVVDQASIMPTSILPCFNSAVIEFHLTNIPGLSEHFIYANDDMFFGHKTGPEYFFNPKGAPIIRARAEKHLEEKAKTRDYDCAILNAKNLIRKIYGNNHNYDWAPNHNINPYRKSYINDMLNRPEIKKATAQMFKNTFRSFSNIERAIFHEYMAAAGLAQLKISNGFMRMIKRIFGCPFPIHVSNAKKLSRMIRKPNLFCINNSGEFPEVDEYNKNFLKKMFPKKSKFEK